MLNSAGRGRVAPLVLPKRGASANAREVLCTDAAGPVELDRNEPPPAAAAAVQEEEVQEEALAADEEVVHEMVVVEGAGGATNGEKKGGVAGAWFKEEEDKLDLAGLLNILDGERATRAPRAPSCSEMRI